MSQPVGRGLHVASASPAPQSAPSRYEQYSFAVQVSPARAPQDLGGPASRVGAAASTTGGGGQARNVHCQRPLMQLHVLQSCCLVWPAVHWTGFEHSGVILDGHCHFPLAEQLHVPHPVRSGIVSPGLQTGHVGSTTQINSRFAEQVQVPQLLNAVVVVVSPGVEHWTTLEPASPGQSRWVQTWFPFRHVQTLHPSPTFVTCPSVVQRSPPPASRGRQAISVHA